MNNDDLYKQRGGKLKLKKGLQMKAKKRRKPVEPDREQEELDMDSLRHGGWKWIKHLDDVKGPVSLQLQNNRYLKSFDDGSISQGDLHDIGEGPIPQEIMTVIPIENSSGSKTFAFKTGFGRYISAKFISENISARAEAIGLQEQWRCKPASKEANGYYLFVVDNVSLSEQQPIRIRNYENDRQQDQSTSGRDKNASGEKGNASGSEATKNLRQFEENQVRLYQKFQDKKLRLNPGAVDDLKYAKKQGTLHERLLDRREKMKSDRYCK
ncbi:hypothetical protein GJ496_000126 [Pomphorhynchus laevis]|nr:hypothetical protein GJ496_000126 [Pomphorhynchus laevis]